MKSLFLKAVIALLLTISPISAKIVLVGAFFNGNNIFQKLPSLSLESFRCRLCHSRQSLHAATLWTVHTPQDGQPETINASGGRFSGKATDHRGS